MPRLGGGNHPGSTGDQLASILEDRATELTERWHAELEARLRIRPQNVFPGSELLDGMPALIRWIAATLRNGRDLSPEQERTAHDLAQFWRKAGYSIEESLLHTGILGAILHDALRSALQNETVEVSAVDAAALSERLCQSLNRIETVLVGTYRDEEEQRLADFGGTLAHEIRGQLNVVMNAAEMLRAAGAGSSQHARSLREDAIDRVTDAIDAAADMIASVRQFSRARSGLTDWTMMSFDEVVSEVVEQLRQETGDAVHVRIEDTVPSVPVPAEAVRLTLHNLVENAIKYADPDKDERWVRIHVRRETDRDRWLVQIGDNGIGIPENEQERIFTRFLRGSRSSGDGFGLGLSIARQAALSIGGTVMLESEEGQGSTFSFTVPFPETLES